MSVARSHRLDLHSDWDESVPAPVSRTRRRQRLLVVAVSLALGWTLLLLLLVLLLLELVDQLDVVVGELLAREAQHQMLPLRVEDLPERRLVHRLGEVRAVDVGGKCPARGLDPELAHPAPPIANP